MSSSNTKVRFAVTVEGSYRADTDNLRPRKEAKENLEREVRKEWRVPGDRDGEVSVDVEVEYTELTEDDERQ